MDSLGLKKRGSQGAKILNPVYGAKGCKSLTGGLTCITKAWDKPVATPKKNAAKAASFFAKRQDALFDLGLGTQFFLVLGHLLLQQLLRNLRFDIFKLWQLGVARRERR